MRSRVLPAVGVSVAALALAATFAPMASAHNSGVGTSAKTPASHLVHANAAGSCYAQRANDNGVGIVSQDFESSLDAYDSQGADDFSLKKTCMAKTVDTDGLYFNGAGPADSVNVTIYKNKKGAPGAVVKAFNKSKYTDSTGTGSFSITLKKGVTLKKGTFWASVQPVMAFSAGGEWGWNTNNTAKGSNAMWQNPGDGFGTGCTSYADMQTCLGAQGEGPDFSFDIK